MIYDSAAALNSTRGLLTLLRDEHQRMDWLLSLYRQQAGIGLQAPERKRLVERIDRHLRALITIKETMLYPMVESKIARPTMAALRCDHTLLQERLTAMAKEVPDTLAMDIHMEELAQQVRDHIAAEECRVFPVAQALDFGPAFHSAPGAIAQPQSRVNRFTATALSARWRCWSRPTRRPFAGHALHTVKVASYNHHQRNAAD